MRSRPVADTVGRRNTHPATHVTSISHRFSLHAPAHFSIQCITYPHILRMFPTHFPPSPHSMIAHPLSSNEISNNFPPSFLSFHPRNFHLFPSFFHFPTRPFTGVENIHPPHHLHHPHQFPPWMRMMQEMRGCCPLSAPPKECLFFDPKDATRVVKNCVNKCANHGRRGKVQKFCAAGRIYTLTRHGRPPGTLPWPCLFQKLFPSSPPLICSPCLNSI